MRHAPQILFGLVSSSLLTMACGDAGTADRLASGADVSTPPSSPPGADMSPLALDLGLAGDVGSHGAFGDPCRENLECDSGFCVEHPDGGRICSQLCGECPEGFECAPITNGGPDQTFVCISDQPDLCKPCESHRDCDDNEDLCLQIGNGTYCGEDCADDGLCPEDYECLEVNVIGADAMPLSARQCVPAMGGTCLPCRDLDGDGFGEGGDCRGYDCDDDRNDVYEGAPELCDGVDNDCNSLVDEQHRLPEPPADVACLNEGVCRETPIRCVEGAWACLYPGTYEAGLEVSCEGIDNDCDGAVDDEFDFSTDVNNCGRCHEACQFQHATGLCLAGQCELGDCEDGWHDADRNAGNGCEFGPCDLTNGGVEQCDGIDNDCDGGSDEEVRQSCGLDVGECRAGVEVCENGVFGVCEGVASPGDEVCDTFDNDCDGSLDEGFDLLEDLLHCGRCNNACVIPQANARCAAGNCLIGECLAGFWDANGESGDGCEYECQADNDGLERCDARDNDCDNRIDEGIDEAIDVNNCGGCGRICEFAHGAPDCRDGQCLLRACEAGYYDIDGQGENGCEYACNFASDVDAPDSGFVDENCDGIDGDPQDAIFVSPRGNDLGDGSMNNPVGTLERARDLALASDPPKYVIAGEGTFAGSFNLPSNLHLHGGYRPESGWSRAVEYETRILGAGPAVVADGLVAPASISHFTIEAATNAQTGGSSVGVFVRGGGDFLTLLGGRIIAGDAGPGSAGLPGDHGVGGNPGARGSDGCDQGFLGTGGCTAQGGGGGGPVFCVGGGSGGAGGGGQAGWEYNWGHAGGNGTASDWGVAGGNGGGGAQNGYHGTGCGLFGAFCCGENKGPPGGGGGGGQPGFPGPDGAGGPAIGSVDGAGLYVPASGAGGAQGAAGGGAGGGGGGGGGDCNVICCTDDVGGAGGGGGSGGCGGLGATGGTGGGGSFGVFIIDASPVIRVTEVRTGGGGRGGDGGSAGNGGPGGPSGGGGNGNQAGGNGGSGGNGGEGGRGGHGGGGGGGPLDRRRSVRRLGAHRRGRQLPARPAGCTRGEPRGGR